MKRLIEKVVLVTGASKGIGSGIAKEMATEGAKVVVNYSSSETEAKRLVQEIKDNGGEAIKVQGDITSKQDVVKVFKEVLKIYKKIDVLVNNAGVYSFEPVENIKEDEFYRQINTNVLGPLLTTQEFLKNSGNEGSVINISSLATERPAPHCALYTATKAALNSMTDVLAKELGTRKIRVNTISPGFTETEGTHEIGVVGSEMEQIIIANTPLGRVGQPEDVAKVAVFLASEESRWVNGQNIAVAGGA